VTAADVLAEARAAGVQLQATPGGKLRWRCPGPLPDRLRHLLVAHKAEVLEVLPEAPPWDSAAADALAVEVQSRRRQLFGDIGWPEVRGTRRQLGELMDRFDNRWSACDLAGLRQAADELLGLLLPAAAGDQVPVAPADLPADWHDAWGERAAVREYDGGLPRQQAEALALADILRQIRAGGLSGGRT
jgi:hypothetical protein